MSDSHELLFVGFLGDLFFQDVISEIRIKYDYKIIYTTTGSEKADESDNNFDYINIDNCYRVETIKNSFFGTKPSVLDEEIINKFHDCKSYFMRTLDRVFLTPRAVRENELYFNELLAYFISFFTHRRNIKAVIFDASPHFPWDILIFFVAKYMGIETRILRRTLLADRVVIDDDFRKDKGKFVCYGEHESFLGDIDDIGNHIESFWLKRSKEINTKFINSFFKSVFNQFVAFFPFLVLTFIKSYQSYTKGYTKLRSFSFFRLLVLQKIKLLSLNKWLNCNSCNVDFSEKFIYFAMHFQPERSTDPEAGEFSHQYIAIRMLSEVLPNGWNIYVKEHPRQISPHPDVRMFHYRSIKDYIKIKSIPNVIIVQPSYRSSELIEKCRMTASCTGSVVWEGLLQGKPGITFGRVWHSQCKSSHVVKNIDDALSAFKVLSTKNGADVLDDVNNFLHDFRNCMILSTNCDMAANSSSVARNVLVENLADALVKSF